MDNKKILEALQMQPLSEEEKTRRHIIARLFGPIATCVEGTRNGRKYNRELWENALADDLFKEKIENKCLFLELGHPRDREETDIKEACACIPSMPQIIDGDLYAYVDILDTANGKLLKTLCDYGFIPGISSRGSGDIIGNDEVDPETFFLETWDIVGVPALKKARLQVCESLEKQAKPNELRSALLETFKNESIENRKSMKFALNNLTNSLTEGLDLTDEPKFELEEVDDAQPENIEDNTVVNDVETDEPSTEDVSVMTIDELIKELEEVNSDSEVIFEPIVIDDKTYEVSNVSFETLDSDNDKKVIIKFDYNPIEDNNIEDEVETTNTEVSSDEIVTDRVEVVSDAAIDDGENEIIESLKEAIRQKDLLVNENRILKNEKTVSDAEVVNLKENLSRYKESFNRVSEVASKVKDAEKQCTKLTEQLHQKNSLIEELQKQVKEKLTESIDENSKKVEALSKKLTESQDQLDKVSRSLESQKETLTEEIQKRTDIAKRYKARCIEAYEKYIRMKAEMLGINDSEITSKLTEGFTLTDVDKVCESLLRSSYSYNRLPQNVGRVNVTESVQPTKKIQKDINPEYGYMIDDSLYELAGIKK